MLIHCYRDVFEAPLHSNERGAEHKKRHSSIVSRVRFFGNFLLSNQIFRLSGVM
jgi:hypothetical protein